MPAGKSVEITSTTLDNRMILQPLRWDRSEAVGAVAWCAVLVMSLMTLLCPQARAAVPSAPAPRILDPEVLKSEQPVSPVSQVRPPEAAAGTKLAPSLPAASRTIATPKFSKAPAPLPAEPSPLTQAEAWVLHELQSNRVADLERSNIRQEARILSGGFLAKLAQGMQPPLGAAGVRIAHAQVRGDVDLDWAQIPAPLVLENIDVVGNLSANEAQVAYVFKLTDSVMHGSVALNNAHIGGSLELQGTRFEHRVSLSSIGVQGALFLDRSEFAEGFELKNATVNGAIQAFRATFNPPKGSKTGANFYGMHVGGDLIVSDVTFHGDVSASHLRVDRNLVLERPTFAAFADFAAGVVGEYLVLEMQPVQNRLRIVQLRYGSISNGQATYDAAATWNDLKPLFAGFEYSSDIYSRLEEFFHDAGEASLADAVYVEQKIQERKRLPATLKALNWLSYATVGYGRHPARAFIWSALFVVIGIAMFWREGGMIPTEGDKPGSKYNSLWYSLDLFLPLTRLQAAERWVPRPERRIAWTYLRIHHLLGWVLVPLGLAALSGLVK